MRRRSLRQPRPAGRLSLCALILGLLLVGLTGCNGFVTRHELQSDNWEQVLQSDDSQVKVRNAQSRVFDMTDRDEMLEALIATFQDLGFQIEVLDPKLGILSGKKYLSAERPGGAGLPTYLLYDEESLVTFNRVYRTWGPFRARADLVRLTATIRKRNAEQLIVRASAQYFLRAVEEPGAYQTFFATLERSLFAERSMREVDGVEGEPAFEAEDDASGLAPDVP